MSAEQYLLVMPKLGLTMTEGTVTQWQIAPGQRFSAGDVVVVIESEKTTVDVDAPADGILNEILIGESQTVPVGTLLANWQLDGHADASSSNTLKSQPSEIAPPVSAIPPPPPATLASVAPTPARRSTERQMATPLARRLARDAGLDLGSVSGSGPRGRIQAADVTAAVNQPEAQFRVPHHPTEPLATSLVTTHDRSPGSVTVPSNIEKTMATRLTAAKRDIPHFYLSVDIDVGPLLELRESLNRLNRERRISVTHLLIAAIVHGLKAVPRMNSVWTEEGFLRYDQINVGIAIDTERGLMSPVVKNLGNESLNGMVRKIDDVIDRARQGALLPDDHQGAAITVSNAGMYNLRYMTSIIVPGQSAILGVGAIQNCFRPDASGAPTLRREIGVVLSADHRLHTGVSALAFLRAFERVVTEPLHLLTSP